MKSVSSEPVLPAAWTQALEKVEQTLAQAEMELALREKELDAASARELPAEDQQIVWRQGLDQWDSLLSGLESFTQLAERNAAETDAALKAGEDAIRDWIETASSNRGKLAEWDARRG